MCTFGCCTALSLPSASAAEVAHDKLSAIPKQDQQELFRHDSFILVAPAEDRDDLRIHYPRDSDRSQRVLEAVAETGAGRHFQPRSTDLSRGSSWAIHDSRASSTRGEKEDTQETSRRDRDLQRSKDRRFIPLSAEV